MPIGIQVNAGSELYNLPWPIYRGWDLKSFFTLAKKIPAYKILDKSANLYC